MARGLKWRKSAYSSTNGGVCVEPARTAHKVAVRDSRTRTAES
ncbi:DUF397 domain-containing protein [uncultured Thermomonospora sp.]